MSTVCMSMQAAEVNQKKAQETAKAFMTQMMAADEQAGTASSSYRAATRRRPCWATRLREASTERCPLP